MGRGIEDSSVLSKFTLVLICSNDYKMGTPHDSVVKNPPANAQDSCSIPGSGRSPGVLKTEFANGLGIGLKKERERSIMDNS